MIIQTEYIHGFFEVEQNGKLGLFDKNGNNIVPCQYDNVQLNQTGYPFGIFVVRQDDKYGCVVNGEERIPCNYYSVIVTEDYIITSLEGELNPRRAMDISNKHQVYDMAIEYLNDACESDSAEQAHNNIYMAQKVIDQLICGLDMQYEISANLL